MHWCVCQNQTNSWKEQWAEMAGFVVRQVVGSITNQLLHVVPQTVINFFFVSLMGGFFAVLKHKAFVVLYALKILLEYKF